MKTINATQAKQLFGELLNNAQQEPVVIQKHLCSDQTQSALIQIASLVALLPPRNDKPFLIYG